MIYIKNNLFIDPQGRQVLLHGINLVNKDPKVGYIGPENADTFAAFRQWGFNCVRLGVIWDGLEPQPGVYNEKSLQGIEQQITWAHANDLYVMLDMHQDLYSVLYSDGAPAWATLHEGQPHTGDHAVWSDAYFTSPAVQTALDNFWGNAPAPDGVGLQDHLASCWQALAERFGKHPAVIGFDLWNEPMMGALAPRALAMQFARGAELLAESGLLTGGSLSPNTGQASIPASDGAMQDPPSGISENDLLSIWEDPQGRLQILELLADPQLYAEVVEAPRPVYNQFEIEFVVPFYQRVGKAIRQVDSDGILFLETSMGSNMGLISAIELLVIDGQRDPQQAYAPHGYDLVVDTPGVAQASLERVNLIFQRHAETARRLNLPMLVGEWGAYGSWQDTLQAARDVVGVFEQLLTSETYWAYEPGIEYFSCFPAISRPYPERVAGQLLSYHYDPQTGRFTCTWIEKPEVTADSVIYLPAWGDFNLQKIEISPGKSASVEIKIQPEGAWLFIKSGGMFQTRSLTVEKKTS